MAMEETRLSSDSDDSPTGRQRRTPIPLRRYSPVGTRRIVRGMAPSTKNAGTMSNLRLADKSSATLLHGQGPSSSNYNLSDQENRIKHRGLKKRVSTSRESSVSSSDGNLIFRAPFKKAKVGRKSAGADVVPINAKELIGEQREKFGERIAVFWDKYRQLETSMTKDDMKETCALLLDVFNETLTEYDVNYRDNSQEAFHDVILSGQGARRYKVPEAARARPMVFRGETTSRIRGGPILPRMRYFIQTEQNINCPDQLRLSHIPYVDETVDDCEWVEELRTFYTEGIHGADHGLGDHMSDFLVYSFLVKLESFKTKFTKTDVRFCVFAMFPNKYSFRELNDSEFLPRLKRRFEKFVPKTKDSLNDVMEAVSTICFRDGRFGCLTHTNESVVRIVPQAIGYPVDQSVSCGKNCGRASFMDSEKAPDETVPPLDENLQRLFRHRLNAYDIDICGIAKLTNALLKRSGRPTMTCYQIAQLAKKEQQVDIEPRSKIPSESARHNTFRSILKQGIDNSKPFRPCNHAGACHEAGTECECFLNQSACTRYCRCGPTCPIIFPGCRCQPGQCRSDSCPCRLAGWECDPETCKRCAPYPVDPNDKCCFNIALQRGLRKKIRVGVSTVAGYGCFLAEPVVKGDFISEYTGEVISHDETERRGNIADRLKLSYVFTLNSDMAIDAGRTGNIIRFANHSNKANCEAKTMMVDGIQRIGIYAKKDIAEGEEIFFDYGYKTHQKKLYVNVALPGQSKKTKKD